MKKARTLGNISFWATLISPMISFLLASMIGEVEIFGVAGIIRYSWIMLLFIPVGVLSIFAGINLKKSNQKYKKNFVITFICVPLLMFFGSYRLIFNQSISYGVDKVSIIEDTINIEIPDEIKVATTKLDLYSESYVKIVDSKEKDVFEQEIKNNQMWQDKLKSNIKSLLPFDIQYETEMYEYFLFYNSTTNEYNMFPLNGQYECIFIAYDCDLQRLLVLDDYIITIN